MTDTQTPTPRTDEAEYGPGKGGIAGSCSANFARGLERECAAMREALEIIAKYGEATPSTLQGEQIKRYSKPLTDLAKAILTEFPQ